MIRVLLIALVFSNVAIAEMLCPTIALDEGHLTLSGMERQLACGDDPHAGAVGLAWSQVPPSQARLQMTSFLQTRGYNQPEFRVENGILHLKLGPRSTIKSIVLSDAPTEIDMSRKRGLVGQILTPSALNDIEQWVDHELRFHGYACPKESIQADAETGNITVHVQPGPQQLVHSVDLNDNLGLVPGTLRRYDAFQVGQIFSGRDLELTENRVINQDILSSTHFATSCSPLGVDIHQTVNGGPPRTLRLGFGVNTEELIHARIEWRHSRLDNHASNLRTVADASFRLQKLTIDGQLYLDRTFPRSYMRPEIVVSREKETSFEFTDFSIGDYYGTTGDSSQIGWNAEIGPVMEYGNLVMGIGPNSSRNLILKATYQIQSHNFEYYLSSPRTGFQTNISLLLTGGGIVSNFSAQRIALTGEYLWNYEQLDPPSVVFGVRAGAATTLTSESVAGTILSTTFKEFLGGSSDIRGYNRMELPLAVNGASTGALTTAFFSFETRFASLLPIGIQPFVFYDLGGYGLTSTSFTSPLLTAPGLGIRWDSPIGVIRGTLAHSYAYASQPIDPGLEHWQAFVLFGQEF